MSTARASAGRGALVVHAAIVGAAVVATAFAVTAGTTAVSSLVRGHWARAPLAALLAAPVLVIAILPAVRRRSDALASRLVYGERAEDYAQMSTFVTRMANTLAVDDVLPRLAQTAAQSVHGDRGEATVWLGEGRRWTRVWPPELNELGPGHSVPVHHAGAAIGEIGVGASSGLGSVDVRVLDELAGPAGLALSTVRLTYALRERLAQVEASTAELRASQDRLVAARRRERERLRAEVDGSIAPLIDATRASLQAGARGDDLAGSLDAARVSVNAGLAALRQLARGILPPQLHMVGPAEALHLWITESGLPLRLQTHGQRGPGAQDAASESAVYFCCAAAAGELARAGARSVAIELAVDGSSWTFSVIPAGDEPPMLETDTVLAIHDRVEALGGELAYEAGVLRGRLPGVAVADAEALA